MVHSQNKNVLELEKIQKIATKMVPKYEYLTYEEITKKECN